MPSGHAFYAPWRDAPTPTAVYVGDDSVCQAVGPGADLRVHAVGVASMSPVVQRRELIMWDAVVATRRVS